jgi:hypothetical protein
LQPHLPSVVLVEPFGPNFSAIAGTLVQDPALQVVECISAMDTLSMVRQMNACVILGHALTPADVNQHITILKTLATQVQQKRNVRMLITVSVSLSAELIEKLTVYGCSEIISDSMSAKAVLYKIERHLKSLPRLSSPEPNAADIKRPKRVTEAASLPEIPAGVRLGPALSVPRDRWCLAGGGARRAQGDGLSWKVHLRGPSPKHGRWLKVAGRKDSWQWFGGVAAASSADLEEEASVPEGAAEPREDARNGWFAGTDSEPVYRDGFWTFVGLSPWLAYVEDGNAVGHKFRINEKGSLLIARDSPKALSWLEAVRSQLARGSFGSVEEQSAPPAPSQIVFVDPLLIKSDCWLIDKSQPKRVAERWLVQLVGPGPAVGRWVAQIGKDRSKTAAHWAGSLEKWWRWVPDAGQLDPFIRELGAWFYFGLAPIFNNGRWSFSSSAPELGFYSRGACYGSKFGQRGDGALEVTRDSTHALNMLSLIRQSFERQVSPRSKTAPPLAMPISPPHGPPVPSDDPRGYNELRESLLTEAKPASTADLVVREEAPANRPDYVDEKGAVPAGLDAIFAAERGAPTLSVLALLVLASELVARRKGSIRERCDRYCAYLLASLGGLRVEIWVPGPNADGWVCIGASDSSPAMFEELAGKGSGLKNLKGMPARVAEIRPGLQDPIGLLIFGGKGSERIEVPYAQAASRAVVGLVLGARQDLASGQGPLLEAA